MAYNYILIGPYARLLRVGLQKIPSRWDFLATNSGICGTILAYCTCRGFHRVGPFRGVSGQHGNQDGRKEGAEAGAETGR